jgi:hypothetical protein
LMSTMQTMTIAMQAMSIVISVIAILISCWSMAINRGIEARMRRAVGHLARLTDEESGRRE